MLTKKVFLAILPGVSSMMVHVAKRFVPKSSWVCNTFDIRLMCSKVRNDTFAKTLSKNSPGFKRWGASNYYHSFLLSTVTRKKNESDRAVEARADKQCKKFSSWLDESGQCVYMMKNKGSG